MNCLALEHSPMALESEFFSLKYHSNIGLPFSFTPNLVYLESSKILAMFFLSEWYCSNLPKQQSERFWWANSTNMQQKSKKPVSMCRSYWKQLKMNILESGCDNISSLKFQMKYFCWRCRINYHIPCLNKKWQKTRLVEVLRQLLKFFI